MSQLQRTVNHCDVCSHEWIPTPGVNYTHCTSGKCRSRKWDQGANAVALGHTTLDMVSAGHGKISLPTTHAR